MQMNKEKLHAQKNSKTNEHKQAHTNTHKKQTNKQ